MKLTATTIKNDNLFLTLSCRLQNYHKKGGQQKPIMPAPNSPRTFQCQRRQTPNVERWIMDKSGRQLVGRSNCSDESVIN
jgi:hypothetical protein